MPAPKQETIALDVLRAASTDVLGQTKPLSVATPFYIGNARGDLKKVDSYSQIQKMAETSAANFKSRLA